MEELLLVSVGEAARRLSLGRSFVFELLAAGDLASIKVGRRRLIPVGALEDFVNAQQESLAESAQ